jgi:hypothetical protein
MQNPNENNLPIIQQNNLQVVDNQLTITDFLLQESEDKELREWWEGLNRSIKKSILCCVDIDTWCSNDGLSRNNQYERSYDKYIEKTRVNKVSEKQLINIIRLRCLILQEMKLSNLNFVSKFTNLQYLNVMFNSITELTPILKLNDLNYLNCAFNNIIDLDVISNLLNLEFLSISGNKEIKNFDNLSKLTKLKVLDIAYTNNYIYNNKKKSLDFLGNLTNLQSLDIRNTYLINFDFIKQLTNLKKIKFGCNDYSYTLKDIEHLANLEELEFDGNSISKLDTIQNFKHLKKLSFRHTKINTLEPLLENKSIEKLYIGYEQSINSLKGLENMIQLKELSFYDTNITSLKPILYLPNLELLNCKYHPIPKSEIEKFKALHPDCEVSHD